MQMGSELSNPGLKIFTWVDGSHGACLGMSPGCGRRRLRSFLPGQTRRHTVQSKSTTTDLFKATK